MKINNKIIKLKRYTKLLFHCGRSAAILLALALVLSLGIAALPIVGTVEAWCEPNPTFITMANTGDPATNISIEWSTTQAYSGSHSVHVFTTAVTTDYAMVGLVTDFVLTASTNISYWGYTVAGSEVKAPDEIWLEFEDGTVICNTHHNTLPAGNWEEWTLSGSSNWYNPQTLSLVDINAFYTQTVVKVFLGAGWPTSAGGVTVDVYLDNLTVDGIILLDDDTGIIEVLCGTFCGITGCTGIQVGIDAALPGDTISVADGTYIITEVITVDKGVTITGNTGSPSSVVVTYAAPQSSNNGFEIGAANITIQGIKVINCKHGFFFDRSNTTYTGCTITHCAVETASNCGIGEIATPSTSISYNTITDCGDKGIYVRNCAATSEAERVEVTSNVISDCGNTWGAACIQTYGSPYTYIYNNTINATNDKGINIIKSGAAGTADRIQVIGNTISETKWPGIQVIGAPYTYVYDNALTQCNYYGADGTGDWDYASIHVQDDGTTVGDHVIIDGNDISDGINGIQIWSDNCTITNNTIYNMGLTYANTKTTGDGTYYNSAILYGDMYNVNMPTSATISSNYIHDNYWGLFVISTYTGTVTAEENWWGDASGPYHPTSNPGGTGDEVSDNVDFIPFLASSGGGVVNNVSITKSGPTSANSGNDITYTITYKNIGTNYATNVVVTETYPSEVEYVSANPAPDIGNNQWTIGTLAPGAEGTITVTVHIK